ncbi:magnesium transporter [Aureitalea marina]|uniref:Magnesium transporter MgtE n=1 Tax=Aureitalea marina TaxID=930804 RepID=A0A2S7KRJ6_9FLAO|nr:magnesium transporter [Aureitalea marina]PQB05252.1 magnesium transporter [Aureitalea marina]
MQFQLTTEFIDQIEQLIVQRDGRALKELLSEIHFADIADLLEELNSEEATYVIKLLESDITSDTLMELDEDVREKILDRLSPKEIAQELVEMDSDDAADVIAELDEEVQEQVIEEIQDEELAADLVELSQYDDKSAGGLMARELVKVKETWTIAGCVREMRRQAKNVTRVHSIYVTDKEGHLTGRLSLKDLLTAPDKAHISDIFIPKVDYVTVETDGEDVAKLMQKYDLEAIPVVDEEGMLVGRITIDDMVDFIKEEAERDYQLAAGISEDVEADDSVLLLTRARLPWLVLGLIGGLAAVFIMQDFEAALDRYAILFFYTPLIAAMAGNVGVQSSAIIVQGLANDVVKGSLFSRFVKELSLSLINGISLALLVVAFNQIIGQPVNVSLAIGVSLIAVIIMASIIGTFVPILLDKRGVDPAIATGPFITTSNDIFGILIYFYISKLILHF